MDEYQNCILARGLYDTITALRRTHPRWSDSWVLVNLRGLTHREAAEILGVTQQRVTAANESARRVLEKELS